MRVASIELRNIIFLENIMRALHANPDSFDNSHDVKVTGVPGACYVFVASTHPTYKDWPTQTGEAHGYLNQRAACLKSHYAEQDQINSANFAAMMPIVDGEHVLVDGIECIVKINGDYSDAATLTVSKS